MRLVKKERSDWITLDCNCKRLGDDGKPAPIQHRARTSDVYHDAWFRTCCVACGAAWFMGEDDKGKLVPVLSNMTELAKVAKPAKPAKRKAS